MRFNCGNPAQRMRDRLQREAEKRAADAKWHRVFAWLPTRVGDSECVWLEQYERRSDWAYSDNPYSGSYWYEAQIEVRSIPSLI